MSLNASQESEVKDYETKKIRIKKETFTERYYHSITVIHHNEIMYPGRFGRRKYGEKECKTFKSAYSCESGCSQRVFLHSCNNINCPRCYINSIMTTAKRATIRFDNIDYMMMNKGFKKRFLRSISLNIIKNKKTFSNGLEIFDHEDFVLIKSKLMTILKKLNFSGLLVFHAYRRERDDNGVLIYPLQMSYSPHFHFIGHGWIPNNFFKKFGFIAKHQRWLFNSKDVYNKIKYLLTHASYFYGKHVLSWFGHYSYNKLIKIDEYKEIEPVVCDICDDNLYLIDLEKDDFIEYKKKGHMRCVSIPSYWPTYLKFDIFLKDITKIYNFEYRGRSKIKKWEQCRKRFKRVRISS